jgi:predicted sulfurtransferase
MEKILLFYKYVNLENPKRTIKWQRQLCDDLDLKGRIILAHEGINGTLGGSVENIDRYKAAMEKNPLFQDIDWKESDGSAACFPRMRIVIKEEITRLGLDPEKITTKDGGIHLTPEQVHELLQNKPDDLVILDTRNNFESAIGTFEGAITPDIRYFRQFPEYVDNNLEQFKDKEVLMFCTGGIRCERATAYVNTKKVAKKVYQIQGGIHRYAEKYPNGFFKGKNYIFDGRLALKVTDDILGSCLLCSKPCDDYTNCLNVLCNKHVITCAPCLKAFDGTCSTQCQTLLKQGKVKARPVPLKVVSPSQAQR